MLGVTAGTSLARHATGGESDTSQLSTATGGVDAAISIDRLVRAHAAFAGAGLEADGAATLRIDDAGAALRELSGRRETTRRNDTRAKLSARLFADGRAAAFFEIRSEGSVQCRKPRHTLTRDARHAVVHTAVGAGDSVAGRASIELAAARVGKRSARLFRRLVTTGHQEQRARERNVDRFHAAAIA